jgi:putative isomerase
MTTRFVYRGAVDADRAWNTWDSVYPADMIHLPLGLRVSVGAYAASRNAFTRFPPGRGVRLGPRTVDGACARLDLEHAGTALTFTWSKPAPDVVLAAWRTTASGEWGLRFWLLLALHVDGRDDIVWRHDEDTGVVTATIDGRHVAAVGVRVPLMITRHADLDALAAEYHDKGYFYLASRDAEGPLVALRYNLEEMAESRVAIAVAASPAAALAAARAALEPRVPEGGDPALHTGREAGALDAVRDVVGWNSVWDPVNRRPYTLLSRHWVAQKFGGFGVWLDDVVYHGLMAGLFDDRWAAENLAAVWAGATPAGNLPCLLTGNDAWVDRSQPPIASFVTRMLHLRTGDRRLIEAAYPVLLANHDWWWATRDGNRNGLLEYGTSPVGRGLYRGTKLAAKDESMMDNSPVHDEASIVPAAHTLDCEDVALNSLIALDGEMLAAIARELGDDATAARLAERTEAHKARVRAGLWDESRGIFANRLWSGRFVRSLAPTSFFPLVAGIADAAQAERMVRDHLLNEREFWGDHVLPAVTRDDPAFPDNVYWRGRVWPPLNTLVYYGLRRAGLDDLAATFAAKSHRTFRVGWDRDRHCGENFSAVSGEVLDQPDTDSFYAWGALMAYLAVADVVDVDPWHGWTVRNDGVDVRVGPLRVPGGQGTVTIESGRLTVTRDGVDLFACSRRGRYSRIVAERNLLSLTVPPGAAADTLTVPGRAPIALPAEGGPIRV